MISDKLPQVMSASVGTEDYKIKHFQKAGGVKLERRALTRPVSLSLLEASC